MRDVSDSRCDRDEEEVTSGVRVRSVRWRERVGCCDGRLVIVGGDDDGLLVDKEEED